MLAAGVAENLAYKMRSKVYPKSLRLQCSLSASVRWSCTCLQMLRESSHVRWGSTEADL